MARIEPDSLADPERVYIAATLRDALLVEEFLTTAGVDYAVQVEQFTTSLFFGARHGAAFYVASSQAAYCRSHLISHGFDRGVVTEQD